MIPKIVHYTWFSGEEYPEQIKKMMETWKRWLPDYEFRLWDKESLKEVNSIFADEAVSEKKWAFAADVTRLYAVYTYGGIWLDTDVELFSSLDPFLDNEMFIGREAYVHNMPEENWLGSHCFGAVAEHPFIKNCLDYYKDRHFVQCYNDMYPEFMRYHMTTIPEVQATLALKWGYDWDASKDTEVILNGEKGSIHIFPSDYFDNPQYKSMDRVVAIHRAFGGWRTGAPKNGNLNMKLTHARKKDIRYVWRKLNRIFVKCGFAVIPVKKIRKV